MNEEEKKAVKFFYNLRATIDESNMLFEEDINVKHGKETIRQITIILNLIEKQQKEIEELKQEMEKRKWVRIKENGEVEPLLYISKDKIREKIKELLKNGKEMTEEERQGQTEYLQGKLKAYEELLEEK